MKRNEPISHLMTKNPITVHPGMKLSEVQSAMQGRGIHHVPVVSGGKLLGLVSASDIARVTYDYGVDGRQSGAVLDHTIQLENLMVTDVKTVGPKDSIRDAYEILSEGRFHALPVVEDDLLVGIVTTTDLLRYALAQY